MYYFIKKGYRDIWRFWKVVYRKSRNEQAI